MRWIGEPTESDGMFRASWIKVGLQHKEQFFCRYWATISLNCRIQDENSFHMKYLYGLIFSIVSASAQSGTLIIDRNVYTVSPTEKAQCGTPGDGAYEASKFEILAARRIGESIYVGSCQAQCEDDSCKKNCETSSKKFEAGLKTLFAGVRKYPSRYSSKACLAFRDLCIEECRKASVVADERCLIECNQYESYNP